MNFKVARLRLALLTAALMLLIAPVVIATRTIACGRLSGNESSNRLKYIGR